jgi:hypothetical protein
MRKRGETFDRLWQGGILDNLLSGFGRWTSIHGVLVSRYEDMVVDPAGEVDQIARYLGIRIRRDECEDVASQYTVARQLERISEAEAAGRLEHRDGFRYDPRSNLHVDHIHSGKSGEWRHVLTRAQVALIEQRAKRWLLANGYALSLPGWQRVILSLGHGRWQRRRQHADAPAVPGG